MLGGTGEWTLAHSHACSTTVVERSARLAVRRKAAAETLTVPYWLNEVAEAHHFSQVLQDALKETPGYTSGKPGESPVGKATDHSHYNLNRIRRGFSVFTAKR